MAEENRPDQEENTSPPNIDPSSQDAGTSTQEYETSSQMPRAATQESPPSADGGGSNQNMMIALIVGGIVIILLLIWLLMRPGDGDSGTDGGSGGNAPAPTSAPVETSVPTPNIPTPQPGSPTFTVTADAGVNVRSGPGTEYESIGALPKDATGQVIGVSEDGNWWVILAPEAPESRGWIASEFVSTEGAESLPVMPPPGAEPTPEPTEAPATIAFTADSTVINAGECTTLRWNVGNVSEVYLYPAGEAWEDYPVTGEGDQEVCPEVTAVYELRVVLTDGNVDTRQIQVQVNEPDVPDSDPLANTSWQLVSIAGSELASAEPVVTLNFDDVGSVAGNGGCNDYNGNYTVNGSEIEFSSIIATEAACEDPIGTQEQAYFAALPTASTFIVDGGELVIFDADGAEALRFVQAG